MPSATATGESGSSPVLLRGYRAADLGAMVALDTLCFERPFRFSRAQMRRFAEARNSSVTIAESAGGDASLAGFSIVQLESGPAGRFGYLVTLDVAMEWRRRGLARLLLVTAEQTVAEAGAAASWLHVATGNLAAQRLYESAGYERAGAERGFYGAGGDALVYRKSLNGG